MHAGRYMTERCFTGSAPEQLALSNVPRHVRQVRQDALQQFLNPTLGRTAAAAYLHSTREDRQDKQCSRTVKLAASAAVYEHPRPRGTRGTATAPALARNPRGRRRRSETTRSGSRRCRTQSFSPGSAAGTCRSTARSDRPIPARRALLGRRDRRVRCERKAIRVRSARRHVRPSSPPLYARGIGGLRVAGAMPAWPAPCPPTFRGHSQGDEADESRTH